MSASVLLIDNFDSFSFNLVDDFARRGCRVEVWRNDVAAAHALALARSLPAPRLVVLSPGPGAPEQAGCCVALVRLAIAAADVPVLGVCLGHQAIVVGAGGAVGFAGEVVHGKRSLVLHDGVGLFAGLPSPLGVARYHSLAAIRLPFELRCTARLESGLTMAVEHEEAPIAGLQFHPESILTRAGGALIDRAIEWAGTVAAGRGR